MVQWGQKVYQGMPPGPSPLSLPPSFQKTGPFPQLHCTYTAPRQLSGTSLVLQHMKSKAAREEIAQQGAARPALGPASQAGWTTCTQSSLQPSSREARARSHTHLPHTSGTGMGTSTHCPGPRRRKCRRRQTAGDCPTAAGTSPSPARRAPSRALLPSELQVLCQLCPRLQASPARRGGQGGGARLANSYQAF